jgi:hypothetical protein
LKARLTEFVQEHWEQAETEGALVAGKMTFGEAAEMHFQSLEANPKLKPATQLALLFHELFLIRPTQSPAVLPAMKPPHRRCYALLQFSPN